jgi:hypothetical protein
MRTLALYTGIVSALTLLKPFKSLVLTVEQWPRMSMWTLILAVGTSIFALVVAAVGLLFYFALYQNQEKLRVSQRLRLLGHISALALGIKLAVDLPTRLSALLSDWSDTSKLDWWHGTRAIWNAAHDPFTAATVNNALDLLLTCLSIALLVALSRNPNDSGSEEMAVSNLLRVVSKMTVVALGTVLVMQMIGLVLAPVNHSLARDYFYRYQLRGTAPRLFEDFMLPKLRMLLVQACQFVAPFLVWRASRGPFVAFPLGEL